MITDDRVKDIIKSRRLQLGLTMKQVAERVGVSEGTVSRWESGDIANMKRDKVVALAKAIDLSPLVIMGWKDAPEIAPAPPDNVTHLLTAEEADLLDAFRELNEEGQRMLLDSADTMVRSGKYIKTASDISVEQK